MAKRKRKPTGWEMGFAPPAPPTRRIKHASAPANANVTGQSIEVRRKGPGGLSALVSDFPLEEDE